MAKAFTKEDASDDDLDREAEAAAEAAARSGPQYITPEGYKRLADELEQLWKVERPRVTREVEAAAALGDRSENAEYIYGKRRLREIDRRLRFLAKRLERITVVAHKPEEDGKVYFGAYVTVTDEDNKQSTYRIVGTDEIDLAKRWISISSPFGKALIGKRLGDFVTVQRPKGEVELEIVDVRYEERS